MKYILDLEFVFFRISKLKLVLAPNLNHMAGGYWSASHFINIGNQKIDT